MSSLKPAPRRATEANEAKEGLMAWMKMEIALVQWSGASGPQDGEAGNYRGFVRLIITSLAERTRIKLLGCHH